MNLNKKSMFPFILIFIFLVTTGFSPVINKKIKTISAKGIEHLEIHINGANVVLEKNQKNSFDIYTYGTLKKADYTIKTTKESNTRIISIKGNNEGTWLEKTGALINIPSTIKYIDIITDGAGIHINDLDTTLNLVTKSSAIIISGKKQNKAITIESDGDAYEINLGIPKANIDIEDKYSVIDLYLSKRIKNIWVDITNKNSGTIDLPKNWKKDYKLGTGKPVLALDNNGGIMRVRLK